MLYRNIKTGAEIETNSVISAPNWITVGADAPKKADPKAETPKEPETIPNEETKEEIKPVKKTAPRKTVKRTKK
jgi:hypothetical protein